MALANHQEITRSLPQNRMSTSLCVSAFKGPQGNDSKGVDVLMRPEIVGLHVMPVACFFDAGQIDHTLNEGL